MYANASTRQLHGVPIAVSGRGQTRNHTNKIETVIHMQQSTHKVPKFAAQVVDSRMQLILHATRRRPHGASRLVHAISACSLETRWDPSRHCRDARGYGRATTAMHELVQRPPPPSCRLTWCSHLFFCGNPLPRSVVYVCPDYCTHRGFAYRLRVEARLAAPDRISRHSIGQRPAAERGQRSGALERLLT